MSEAVLKVEQLAVHYGAVHAVRGINLEVHAGELIALIGANGAGKTTTLKAIVSALPWTGNVHYLGRSTRGRATHQLAAQGLALVPEGRGVFARMSVLENLQMGAYARRDQDEIDADLEKMLTLFPRLRERSAQLAGTLSGGEQQMLALARALMSRPRLLLLDEPSMGLAPLMVEKIFEVIRTVSAQGVPILLVEQNARLALQAAHRAYVLDAGEITLQGHGQDLLNDERVRQAYLGEVSREIKML